MKELLIFLIVSVVERIALALFRFERPGRFLKRIFSKS